MLRYAHWAVAAVFFANGFIWGSWAAHIALLPERHGIGTSALGVALLMAAAGALIAMQMTGGLIRRIGSGSLTIATGFAFSLAFLGPVLAPSFTGLALALLLMGAANGAMDVAMNAEGVAVEKALVRPIMSSLHGMFSVGGLAGAAMGGFFLELTSPAIHAACVTLFTFAVIIIASRHFLPTQRQENNLTETFATIDFAIYRDDRVLALGLLAFLALMAEGSVLDWSALFLAESREARAGVAALGFAGFSLAMALCRFTGDKMRQSYGNKRVVEVSAAVAASGLAIALLLPSAWLGIVGFVIVGLGLANMCPILFGAAGTERPDEPGRAIAAVATLGYLGFLVGPPVIGIAADIVGLGPALGLIVCACATVSIRASHVINARA